MPNYSKLRKEWINQSRDELLELARDYQKKVLDVVHEQYLDLLDINGKKIVFNQKNMTTLSKLTKILTDLSNIEGDKLLDWFLEQFEKNTDLNKSYFSEIVKNHKKAYDDAYEKLWLRLGVVNGRWIQESTLFDVSRIIDPIKKIKAYTIKAIALGKSYNDFLKDTRRIINPVNAIGVIESHVRTNVYDTFQQVDRTFANDMAIGLDLNYALYSEGLMTTSRQFCIDRVGKVFTRAEIEGWKKLDWQGKPADYDPFVDVGGHNCTHTLDWITEDLAFIMRPDLKAL